MLAKPGVDGSEQRLRKSFGQQPQYAGQMFAVDMLAVSNFQAGKNARHFAVTLNSQNAVVRDKYFGFDVAHSRQVAMQGGFSDICSDRAPGVFEKGHEIISSRADDGILEIK